MQYHRNVSLFLAVSLSILALSCMPDKANASLAPHEVLIVVNRNNPVSQELGNYYADKWLVPEQNIVYVDWPLNKMGWGDINNGQSETNAPLKTNVVVKIKTPIEQTIAARGLTINCIVLSWDLPYVMRDDDTTYGMYHEHFIAVQGFLAQGSAARPGDNQYYSRLGTGYESAALGGQRIVFHLFGYDIKEIKALIDSGVAADGSFPDGTVYFQPANGWSDTVRGEYINGFRYPSSRTIAPEVLAMGVKASRAATTDNDWSFAPKATNVLGILTGYGNGYTPSKNYLYDQMKFLPGALADHVTSGGGRIDLWSDWWHFNINEWINLGATATFGSVDEPYAVQSRFPHVRMYLAYAMGASLGETYYSGVRDTILGAFVGDPLCAPFARRPVIGLSLADGATVTGAQTVTLTGTTTRSGAGIGRISVFVDDLPVHTVSAPAYVSGSKIHLTIAGTTLNYTIPAGATQSSIMTGLVAMVNGSTLPLRASATGVEFPGALLLTHAQTGSAARVAYGVTTEGAMMARTIGSQLYCDDTSTGMGRVFVAPGQQSRSSTFTLDPAVVGEGWHMLRAVAWDSSLLEIAGWKVQRFCMNSSRMGVIRDANGGTLPANCRVDLPLNVRVNESFSKMAIYAGSMLLKEIAGAGPYSFSLDISTFGNGPLTLQAVGTDSTGKKVYGKYQELEAHVWTRVSAVWPQAGSGQYDTPWVLFSGAVNTTAVNVAKIRLFNGTTELACTRVVDTDNRIVRLFPGSPLPSSQCELRVPTNVLDACGNMVESVSHKWTPIAEAGLIFRPQPDGPWFTSNGDNYNLMPEWTSTVGNLVFSGTVNKGTRTGNWSGAYVSPCLKQGPSGAPLGFSPFFQLNQCQRWTKFDLTATIKPGPFTTGGSWDVSWVPVCWVGVGSNLFIVCKDYLVFQTARGTVAKMANHYAPSNTSYNVRMISTGDRIDVYLNGMLFASSIEPVQGGTLLAYASKTGLTEFSGLRLGAVGGPNAAPSAGCGNVTVVQNRSETIALPGFDPQGDALTYRLTAMPTNGTAALSGSTVLYTPKTGYLGEDGFRFVANDGRLNSNTGVISILVTTTNTLIGHWKFDETSGTTAADSSGNGRNGVVAGGAVWSETGRVSRSLKFDGIDDKVTVPSNALAAIRGESTIAMWINPAAFATNAVCDAVGGKHKLWLASTNRIIFDCGGAQRTVTLSTPFKSNEWQHVAIAHKGSMAVVYRNGSPVAWENTAWGGVATVEWVIGGKSTAGKGFFKGQLDDVRLYNRALNGGEIASLAKMGTESNGVNSVTSYGTPYSWLSMYGASDNYETAQNMDLTGKGMMLWEEYLAGTDPADAASLFRVSSSEFRVGEGMRLTWTTYTNWIDTPFGIERCTNLVSGIWLLVDGNVTRTPPTNIWTDVSPPQGVPCFYRIVATNSP